MWLLTNQSTIPNSIPAICRREDIDTYFNNFPHSIAYCYSSLSHSGHMQVKDSS